MPRYFVTGRVQGVGYRYFAVKEASRLGLRGYARNLADGRVEVLALGPAEALDEFAGHLRTGPRWADVRCVDIEESTETPPPGFEIR